ncbi:hypothetical protein HRbin16_01050 [bacterium HR16]|nr:hypothetical protein HRbin16_01050 [bacterium HR16]
MAEVLINIQIEALEEGGYLATSTDLQGLVAQGRTLAETMEIAQDVARKLIESCVEHGDPLPEKISQALRRQRRKATVKIPVGITVEAA